MYIPFEPVLLPQKVPQYGNGYGIGLEPLAGVLPAGGHLALGRKVDDKGRFLTFEKRMAGTTGSVVLVRAASVAVAVLVTVVFLFCIGKTPAQVGDVLYSIFVLTIYPNVIDVIVKAIPLIITSIGISIAFRMKLWNIGGEGQIAMGAFAATGVAMLFPGLPGWLLLLVMAVAAMLAGGLWAAIAAAPQRPCRQGP